jgi:hypothetical protein
MIPSTQAGVPASVVANFDSMRQSGSTVELQRELNAAGLAAGLLPPPASGSSAAVNIGSSLHRVETTSRPPQRSSDGRMFVYPTIFYGGTGSAGDAETITIGAAEERTGINFQLRPLPAFRVAGSLSGPDGPAANVAVRLVEPDSGNLRADLDVAATVSDARGQFSFEAVPVGDYTLKVLKVPRASGVTSSQAIIETGGAPVAVFSSTTAATPPPVPDEPTLWANVAVAVREADIANLRVNVQPGARISGRVEFSATMPPPAAAALQRLSVAIHPADGRALTGGMVVTGSAPSGRVDAQRQVTLPGLPAGEYTFNVGSLPPGWFVQSITIDGRDAWDAPFEIGTVDVSTLVITFTDRATGLTGQVRERGGQAAAGARVFLFPTDRRFWTMESALGRRIRMFTASPEGEYVAAVPPGEYFVVVLPESDRLPSGWSEPSSLAKLSQGAERVELPPGQQHIRNLTIGMVRR